MKLHPTIEALLAMSAHIEHDADFVICHDQSMGRLMQVC